MPEAISNRYRTFWDTPTMQVAERAMRHSVARHRVLAHNLANANTPRYVRQDLPFPAQPNSIGGRAVQLALQQGADSHPAMMRTTNPRHYATLPTRGLQETLPASFPTPMRTDGNTVDPEHEMALLAENELRYAMLVRIAGGQVRTLLTAINGGRNP